MIASDDGVTSAAAAPWRARAAISVSIVGATAQATEKTPKPASPMREDAPLTVDVAE